jgi:hypothetical protein
LRAALQKYLDNDPKSDFWQTFDAETCSWDQVFEELNNAEEAYKVKGKINPIRRAFRHGAGFSRTLRPLVDGIPQDNGLGLLRGGLQIIFNVGDMNTDMPTTYCLPGRAEKRRSLRTSL